MVEYPPLIVVVGPTAVGKTSIAIQLANDFDGEIVSADSRQVYRGMDIGTAKPTAQQQKDAVHHLIDILSPNQPLHLAKFQELAYRAIEHIHQRGRVPFLVGGTGQYVRAVVEGWGIPRVPPQPGLRADLTAVAEVYGPLVLHTWLVQVDPAAAAKIDYRNVRRVVRALEVYLVSGTPITEHQENTPPSYRVLQVGLTRSRESLYQRTDVRVEQMMTEGLLAEVKGLYEAGFGWNLSSMASLGYRQFAPYFEGEADLDEVVEKIKTETHRYIRHQDSWFDRDDDSIQWFDLDEKPYQNIRRFIAAWLAG